MQIGRISGNGIFFFFEGLIVEMGNLEMKAESKGVKSIFTRGAFCKCF